MYVKPPRYTIIDLANAATLAFYFCATTQSVPIIKSSRAKCMHRSHCMISSKKDFIVTNCYVGRNGN